MRQMQSRRLACHTVSLSAHSDMGFLGFVVEIRVSNLDRDDPKSFVARRRFNAKLLGGIENAMEMSETAYEEECALRRFG